MDPSNPEKEINICQYYAGSPEQREKLMPFNVLQVKPVSGSKTSLTL